MTRYAKTFVRHGPPGYAYATYVLRIHFNRSLEIIL